MAFWRVRKVFRPIRRDLSKHITDFMQQVQVLCDQTSIARKLLCTKSTKALVHLTMAQGSTRFEYLEKSIDDYIIKQQKKISRANTTRDVKLSYSLNFGEKNTRKTSKPRDWTNISAICVKWKDGKDSEPSSHVSKDQQKSMSKILIGSTLQWFKLKRTLSWKQQKKKVQRRQQ